jgi:hypothetical protein
LLKAALPGSSERVKIYICNRAAILLAKKNLIQRLLAGIMLVLFAFSITPKMTLHDLFAHHKDTLFSASSKDHAVISLSGFRCNCENLVVESPFVAEITIFKIGLQHGLSSLPVTQVKEFYPATHFFPDFRGPPAFPDQLL